MIDSCGDNTPTLNTREKEAVERRTGATPNRYRRGLEEHGVLIAALKKHGRRERAYECMGVAG